MIKHKKNISGQALPYFMMMMVALVLCWAMMINIAKLLKDRMVAQNAADNAALSCAVHQARMMNMLARINKAMAEIFYNETVYVQTGFPLFGSIGAGGGNYGICGILPVIPQKAGKYALANNVSKIAAIADIIAGMTKCNFGRDCPGKANQKIKAGINSIIARVNLMVTAQTTISKIGPAFSGTIARDVAKRQEFNSKDEPTGPTVPQRPFGINSLSANLKKNRQKIEYYEATHSWFSIPPVPIVKPDGQHGHWVLSKRIGEIDASWRYGKEDSFHRKRIILRVVKDADDPSNKGYPFLGKWFGIEWPKIHAIAAAAYYNPESASFVLKSENKSEYKKIEENIEAESGGWHAQLVPLGIVGILH